jgi:hypothetical protein
MVVAVRKLDDEGRGERGGSGRAARAPRLEAVMVAVVAMVADNSVPRGAVEHVLAGVDDGGRGRRVPVPHYRVEGRSRPQHAHSVDPVDLAHARGRAQFSVVSVMRRRHDDRGSRCRRVSATVPGPGGRGVGRGGCHRHCRLLTCRAVGPLVRSRGPRRPARSPFVLQRREEVVPRRAPHPLPGHEGHNVRGHLLLLLLLGIFCVGVVVVVAFVRSGSGRTCAGNHCLQSSKVRKNKN